MERLLSVTELTAERAYAVAHIGARTGDPGRDVDDAVSAAAAERLSAAGFTDAAYQLREIVETSASETGRVFGEALPEGLKLGVPVR